jgi:hypothetical protein
MKNLSNRILASGSLLLLLLLLPQAGYAQKAHGVAIGVARVEVLSDVERAWAAASAESTYFEVLELKSSEYRRIFPRGLGHLPAQLSPREIYPATTEEDARRWQYLGTRTWRGFKFAIFRLVTH